jgi:ABC-type nitrate/sulfonate/bicarbonate transport system permease component
MSGLKARGFTRFVRSPYLLGGVLLLVLWQAFSLIAGARIVPPPIPVLTRFAELLPGVLWRHALASFARVALSLLLSTAAAIPVGLAAGRSRRADALLSPLTYLLYPVPKIALLPVVMLLFGMGDLSKVIVVSLVLFFQTLVTVRDAAREVEPQYLVSIRSLGAGRLQVLRYVILPAILPALFTSVRIGAGTALAVLFFAETFATKHGLGYFIMDGWMRINYLDMFAGIVGIGVLGLALFRLIDLLERRLCPWKDA